MGGIGDFFNSLTSPVGVKLFSGGPYADRQFGSQALNAVQNLPGTNDLGALGGLSQIYSQMAKMYGLPDFVGLMQQPTAGLPAQSNDPAHPGLIAQNSINQNNAATLAQQEASFDPNKFTPVNQRQFNQQAGDIAQQKQNVMSGVRARLSARGLGDSSTMAAAEAYLQQKYGGITNQTETQMLQGQQGQQQQALQSMAAAVQQMFQDQMNRANQKAGGFQQAGQQAIQTNSNALNQLGNFAGLLAGGGNLGGLLGGGGGGSSEPVFGSGAQWYIDNPGFGLGNVNWGAFA